MDFADDRRQPGTSGPFFHGPKHIPRMTDSDMQNRLGQTKRLCSWRIKSPVFAGRHPILHPKYWRSRVGEEREQEPCPRRIEGLCGQNIRQNTRIGWQNRWAFCVSAWWFWQRDDPRGCRIGCHTPIHMFTFCSHLEDAFAPVHCEFITANPESRALVPLSRQGGHTLRKTRLHG
ncbi:hypothetical protein SAMN04488515_3226 [Cognatiyoonia koreensis]|uniref:Uncharacterized protein n=1 Tax=Cognatiyoonia koreensis TaxID=364200 RepID=A0A1I0RTN4_9RHOB|nr:hypothetical protein SAMN04488515_3226 [Cognatiyoonia koreensis]